MSNKIERIAAIEGIVQSWVSSDVDCLGQLLRNESFRQLLEEVQELRGMHVSPEWRSCIAQWEQTIQFAVNSFHAYGLDEEFKSVEGVWDLTINDFTITTGRVFANAIKWAAFTGAVRAMAAA